KVADMNGDGMADVVHIGSDEDASISVLTNTGSGWQGTSENYSSTPLLAAAQLLNSSLRLEDINRDGMPDLVSGDVNSLCYIGPYGINRGKNHSRVIRNTTFMTAWDTRDPIWCDTPKQPP